MILVNRNLCLQFMYRRQKFLLNIYFSRFVFFYLNENENCLHKKYIVKINEITTNKMWFELESCELLIWFVIFVRKHETS